MRLVVLGGDVHVFKSASTVRERIRSYATHFEHVSLFVLSRTWYPPQSEHGLHIHSVLWHRILVSGALWRAVRSADVVSVQDPFFIGCVGMILAAACRKSLHVQIHTDIYAHGFAGHHVLNRVRLWCAYWVIRAAARIRVVTRDTEKNLRERGIQVPITYLPIYVDIEAFSQVKRKPSHERVTFLCVGRLEPEKQFIKAIEALAGVCARGYDAELVCVGSGTQEAMLRARANELGVSQRVRFEGHQPHIVPYLEVATALLVPSRYEGYGMVIVEALAAGVPVLSTPVGVAEEAGAVIVPEATFTEGVLSWLAGERKAGVLRGYPYASREAYVRAWVEDVCASARK
jgi:glycosyltransferase involved in cell wall biosynthesis